MRAYIYLHACLQICDRQEGGWEYSAFIYAWSVLGLVCPYESHSPDCFGEL